ncbi:Gfo/Idh/MocA family oxidoreductase [Microbacterium sp. NPDC019599]|uniref:Gfo/Idh/MocA family protein n=1 Tax=Microbacterium sp. NPDC019599 TaxID=3154690 RepID=UPI0033D7948F
MGGSTLTDNLTGSHHARSAPLRVGIIGTGVISGQYFASFARLPEVEVVAVADLDAERARTVAREHGARALSVDALLADDEVDLVLNLTIPAAHAEVSMAALAAGKHVYVEKPLCSTVEEGKALLRAAGENGLRLAAAPDTVLGTGIQTARALIDRGEIGTPIGASASWSSPGHERWHPAPDFYYRPGGGPLFDMGPYYLTTLVTLLGPVVRVSATSRRSDRPRAIATGPRAGESLGVEIDTHITAHVEHASGAVSTLMLSFEVWGSRQPHIEVFGTAGTVAVPDPNRFDGKVELLDDSREWRVMDDIAGYIDSGRGFGIADLARRAAAGEDHRASAELALHVVDIMASIDEAARTGAPQDLTTTAPRPDIVPLEHIGLLELVDAAHGGAA